MSSLFLSSVKKELKEIVLSALSAQNSDELKMKKKEEELASKRTKWKVKN